METYLTIAGLAEHLKLSAQTIRRYVMNGEVPYHKIKKVIRFRLSEIEQWVERGGLGGSGPAVDVREGDLFADLEAGEVAGTGETGTDGETEETPEAGQAGNGGETEGTQV